MSVSNLGLVFYWGVDINFGVAKIFILTGCLAFDSDGWEISLLEASFFIRQGDFTIYFF